MLSATKTSNPPTHHDPLSETDHEMRLASPISKRPPHNADIFDMSAMDMSLDRVSDQQTDLFDFNTAMTEDYLISPDKLNRPENGKRGSDVTMEGNSLNRMDGGCVSDTVTGRRDSTMFFTSLGMSWHLLEKKRCINGSVDDPVIASCTPTEFLQQEHCPSPLSSDDSFGEFDRQFKSSVAEASQLPSDCGRSEFGHFDCGQVIHDRVKMCN
jgi:hypothetical protein